MRPLPELDITDFMPEILQAIQSLPETELSWHGGLVRVGKVEVVQDGDRMLLWADTY